MKIYIGAMFVRNAPKAWCNVNSPLLDNSVLHNSNAIKMVRAKFVCLDKLFDVRKLWKTNLPTTLS